MKNNPTNPTTCELCNERPAQLHLNRHGLNVKACWPCGMWQVTGALDELRLHPGLHKQEPAPPEPAPESSPVTIIVSESKKSKIIMATKEIVAWALAL